MAPSTYGFALSLRVSGLRTPEWRDYSTRRQGVSQGFTAAGGGKRMPQKSSRGLTASTPTSHFPSVWNSATYATRNSSVWVEKMLVALSMVPFFGLTGMRSRAPKRLTIAVSAFTSNGFPSAPVPRACVGTRRSTLSPRRCCRCCCSKLILLLATSPSICSPTVGLQPEPSQRPLGADFANPALPGAFAVPATATKESAASCPSTVSGIAWKNHLQNDARRRSLTKPDVAGPNKMSRVFPPLASAWDLNPPPPLERVLAKCRGGSSPLSR